LGLITIRANQKGTSQETPKTPSLVELFLKKSTNLNGYLMSVTSFQGTALIKLKENKVS